MNKRRSGIIKYNSILELIGNTPVVRLNKIGKSLKSRFYVKLESFNPGSSVKDRIAFNMIEEAEKNGLLHANSTIVEPTSGNTGIGLAMVCAVKGYKIILTMPESMSIERRKILKAYGAQIILTPKELGMKGAINKAMEIASEKDNVFIPQQFKNKANPEAHRKTTALEILRDFGRELDVFVAGIGTGGTITGVGERLKKENPHLKVIGVEPEASPVLSGGTPGPHKIQGIGAGFIPDVLNRQIIDEVIKVKDEEAFAFSRRLAAEEGIFAGISSGAALAAAVKYAKINDKDQDILVLLPDTGERYLSTDLWSI